MLAPSVACLCAVVLAYRVGHSRGKWHAMTAARVEGMRRANEYISAYRRSLEMEYGPAVKSEAMGGYSSGPRS